MRSIHLFPFLLLPFILGACDSEADPRAFSGIPAAQPWGTLDEADLVLVHEIGSLEGPTAFGAIRSAAIDRNDSIIAVADNLDCGIAFVPTRTLQISHRVGGCGDGPEEFREPGAIAFVGDSLLVHDVTRRAFAMISPSGGPFRWFRSDVLEANSSGVSQISSYSDTTVLVSRYLPSPRRTLGSPGLLAEVALDDGRIVNEFLEDSPISLGNPNPTQGRRARACAMSDDGQPVIAVANQWMGQIALLHQAGVRASWDITPGWYQPQPHLADSRTMRPPVPGAHIACTDEFAVASYRVGGTEGIEHSRIAIVDVTGKVLRVRELDRPAWPDPGLPAIVAGGSSFVVGLTNRHAEFPQLAIYRIEYDSAR